MKKYIYLIVSFLILFFNSLNAQTTLFYLDIEEQNNIYISDIVKLNELTVIQDYSILENAFGQPLFEPTVSIGPDGPTRSKDYHFDGARFLYHDDGVDLILADMEIVKDNFFVKLQNEIIKTGDHIQIFEYLYEDLYKNPSIVNVNGNKLYSYNIYFRGADAVLSFEYDNSTKLIISIVYFQRTT
jgi:hypothetical protein